MVGEFENNLNKGIIPRSFDHIFNRIKKICSEDKTTKYTVQIAFIQIYLESIQDLFEPENEIKIRESPEEGVFIENVCWRKVTSTAECAEEFRKGEKNR